jgi:hypothetical protein
MYDRYAGRWYSSLTFIQKTTITLPSGSSLVQTWYEALSLPGKLRIDVEAPSRGNGSLFRHDSVYQMMAGRVAAARPEVNELLVLGFDVYAQPPSRTAEILRSRGFDLGRSHESSWDGKPVIVIGASAGDTTSKQFWVERERLLFVRLIDPTTRGRADTRFGRYVTVGGGWVAARVDMFLDGRPRLREEYTEIRPNPQLDPDLFDPTSWSTARHWFGR